jgi:Trp operon repressor
MKNTFKVDWIAKILAQASKNKKETKNFLIDILTPAEIDDIYNRLKIVEELIVNKSPHREVSKKFRVSISKVTRAVNVIKYGSGIFHKIYGVKKISQ